MSHIRRLEPPLSARRAAIFRQADEARRVAAELRDDYLRLRALLDGDDPYRVGRVRRSKDHGGAGARSEA